MVADEAMLPPESIRFFYLDNSWLDALIDGAFGIGRNLSDGDQNSGQYSLEKAISSHLRNRLSLFSKEK